MVTHLGPKTEPRPCLLVGLTHGGRAPGPPAHSAQVLQLWGSVPGQVRLPGNGGGLPGSRWAGSRRQGSSSHSEHSSQQSPRCLGDETCLEKRGLSALAPSLRLAVAEVSSPYWSLSKAGPGRFWWPRELSRGVWSWKAAPAHRDSCSTSVRKLCFTVVHSRSASCSPQGKWGWGWGREHESLTAKA